MGIKIDESKLSESPSFFSKVLNVFQAMFFGALFVQILAFFRLLFFIGILGTIVFWYNNPIFIVFEGVCAIMGWVYGAEFISWIRARLEDWNIIPENWWWWR